MRRLRTAQSTITGARRIEPRKFGELALAEVREQQKRLRQILARGLGRGFDGQIAVLELSHIL